MGQKVNPTSFRLGFSLNHLSNWVVSKKKDFAKNVIQDERIRSFLERRLSSSYVEKIEIVRGNTDKITLTIHSSKPGYLIGKQGSNVDKIKNELKVLFKSNFEIDVAFIKKEDTIAALLARSICDQIKGRVSCVKAAKEAISQCMRAGSKGVKIKIAGRLDGAEMAREDSFKDGRVPLHTLRASIDYTSTKVKTIYGIIGVKVWVYSGDIYDISDRYNSSPKERFFKKHKKKAKLN